MVAKRKAVTGSATKLFKSALGHESAEVDGIEDAKTAGAAVMKKPAAVDPAHGGDEDHDEASPMETHEDEEAEEEGEEESEEQKVQKFEEEETAKRKKELKAMPANELKELAASQGVEASNKASALENIVAHEAKLRADRREHEAKLRAVVVQKKEELEAQTMSELTKLCAAIGLKGVMSKQARVEHLLKHWQEEGGVDKALAQMAHNARKAELESMDKVALQELCEKLKVDPLMAEAMVDRISKREHELGCYSRPGPATDQKASEEEGQTDMINAILVNEQKRKNAKEFGRQQQDAVANKRKELKAMTVEELKNMLTTKGVEAAGKKDEMVEALLAITSQEEAISAKKAELKALSVQELKELVASKRLEAGSKAEMVDALMAHEAKLRDDLRAFEAKVAEVLAQKKAELEAKTNSELKDLCANKGLKLGTGKEERVERLLDECKKDGEVDRAVGVVVRKERKEALKAMDKHALLQLCDQVGADPFVKEVMVERILSHESEAGVAEESAEPAVKRARASKK